MQSWELSLLADVKQEFGSIPPQWVVFPEYHPVSMGWRMGGGESYAVAWRHWFKEQNFTFDEKVAYFKQYKTPDAWLMALVEILYEDDLKKEFGDTFIYYQDEEKVRPYFERLQALGFGGYDEWKKDYEDEEENWD